MERADLARHLDAGSMPAAQVAEELSRCCSITSTVCGALVAAAPTAAHSIVEV